MLKPTQISPALEEKYGPDFRRKLEKYRTATLKGEHVAICEIDSNSLDALVRDVNRKYINCCVNDLDNFVL